jgi:Mn-dependent DtxR family transcriptional regulator
VRANHDEAIAALVSAPVLARWLGVTPKTVRELAKAGIVIRAGRGQYRLEDSVRG